MRSTFGFAVAAAAMLVGCHHDDQDTKKELAALRQEVQGLRAQVAQGAAAGRPQPPRPVGPDPAKVYAVGVAGDPAVGPAAAPLTVVIAYEYACPWCNKQRQAFAQVRDAYGDDVRFVFRPFVVHPDMATDAALAACAADRQGHFAEVSDALWSNVFDKRAFDRVSVESAAGGVAGIDRARLRADMDGECKAWVERESAALAELGVNATPQVWVNGRPVPGGYKPLEKLKPLLDEELGRAKQRIAAGTPREAYYAEWVLKKGLPRVEVASN
jgi:protein-disulfide isomerase